MREELRRYADFRKVNGSNSLLLLRTTGARSGKPRVNPLAYTADGERLVIIASKGGTPTNPDWYHNIVAHPDVTVEVGTETFEARATVVEGPERDALYAKQAAMMPNFAEYQAKTTRNCCFQRSIGDFCKRNGLCDHPV